MKLSVQLWIKEVTVALIIDTIYIFRELSKLFYVVVTSPFAVIAAALMIGSYQWEPGL